jgi:hypothetical protein
MHDLATIEMDVQDMNSRFMNAKLSELREEARDLLSLHA